MVSDIPAGSEKIVNLFLQHINGYVHPIPAYFLFFIKKNMMSSPDVLLIFCGRREENRRVQFPVGSSREAVSASSTHSSSSPHRGAALRQGSLPAARGTVNPGLGVLQGRKGGVGVGATKKSRMVQHILGTRAAVIGSWKRLAVGCCCSMEAVWSGGRGAADVAAVDTAVVADVPAAVAAAVTAVVAAVVGAVFAAVVAAAVAAIDPAVVAAIVAAVVAAVIAAVDPAVVAAVVAAVFAAVVAAAVAAIDPAGRQQER